MEYLHKYFEEHPAAEVFVIKSIKCKGAAHLKVVLEDIIKKRGEGVALRRAGTLYTSGRTSNMLKVKVQALI